MEVKNLQEDNELQNRAKKHKKNNKGLSFYCTLNPDAGNVEHNVAMFNKMNSPEGGPSLNPCGPMAEDVDNEDVSHLFKLHVGDEVEYKGKTFVIDDIRNDPEHTELVSSMLKLEDEWIPEEMIIKNFNEELREELTMDFVDLHYDDLEVTVVTRPGRSPSPYFEYDRDEAQTAEDTIIYDYTVSKKDVVDFLAETITENDFPEIENDDTDQIISFINDNFDSLFDKYESMILDYFRKDAREHAELELRESFDIANLSESYGMEKFLYHLKNSLHETYLVKNIDKNTASELARLKKLYEKYSAANDSDHTERIVEKIQNVLNSCSDNKDMYLAESLSDKVRKNDLMYDDEIDAWYADEDDVSIQLQDRETHTHELSTDRDKWGNLRVTGQKNKQPRVSTNTHGRVWKDDKLVKQFEGPKYKVRADMAKYLDSEIEDTDEGWNPDLVDCPACGDLSFDSKRGRCTKCSYRENVNEHYEFDDEDEGINVHIAFDVNAPSNLSETQIETIIRKALAPTNLIINSYMEVHLLDESMDEELCDSDSTFLVDDQLEWTSLDGTRYKAQVIDVSDDSVRLDMMHKDPETGNDIVEQEWFDITSDPDGKTCIIPEVSSNREDAVYVYPIDEVDECINESDVSKHKLVRIAKMSEFDNGHVIHTDWKKMTRDQAEKAAKQASISDSGNVYYVSYDDVMDPGSDIRWFQGQGYHYTDVTLNGVKDGANPIISATTSNRLDEANYGGAFDIDPEQYFTREDLLEFADEVIACISSREDVLFDVCELYIDGNDITLGLNNSQRNGDFEHYVTFRVDMRKIRYPHDLSKYVTNVANEFIKEYRDQCAAELNEATDNEYTYKGYNIIFAKNGECSVVDKDGKHLRGNFAEAEAREFVDSLTGASPDEENQTHNIRYPNGSLVSDMDLEKALDYMYGTDRNPEWTYTDVEMQKAVNRWLDKIDPRPDGKSYNDLTEENLNKSPKVEDPSIKESVEEVKQILQPRVTKYGIRPFGNNERIPRRFSFKSSSGRSGEVTYNGVDYVYAIVDGTVRVMTSSQAGSNWSETIYK